MDIPQGYKTSRAIMCVLCVIVPDIMLVPVFLNILTIISTFILGFKRGAIVKKGPYIDRVPLMFVRGCLKILIAPNLPVISGRKWVFGKGTYSEVLVARDTDDARCSEKGKKSSLGSYLFIHLCSFEECIMVSWV